MKKLILIDEPVFKSAIHLFWGYSFEQVNHFLASRAMDEVEEDYKGSLGLSWSSDEKGTSYHSIWLSSAEWTLKEQAVFAHELCHAIFDVMDAKGLTIYKNDCNESYCYLYEYYFLRFCREIQRVVDKQNSKDTAKAIKQTKR